MSLVPLPPSAEGRNKKRAAGRAEQQRPPDEQQPGRDDHPGIVIGQAGPDTLTGGAGADFLSGGPGADTFIDFNTGEGDTTDGT